MKQLALSVNPVLLTKLLALTFERLPEEYLKAVNKFKEMRRSTYFRETLVSDWIAIGLTSQPIFRQFHSVHRFSNIVVTTVQNYTTELKIYINNYGIIGISIAENFEDLLLNTIDTSQFRIEDPPVSKFYASQVDLQDLEGFEGIKEYLNLNSSEYIIAGASYYSIIELSDQKCIAVNEKNSIFLINKLTGLIKLLYKRPNEFVDDFKNDRIGWVFN